MASLKKIKLQLARDYRGNPTKSEEIMWESLRNRAFQNLKFRRQYLRQGYLLDFYCASLRVAVEIDGPIHRARSGSDRERQIAIEESGVRIYRVSSDRVESDVGEVLRDLARFVDSLTPAPSPARSSRARGG